jgi:hypothetical protein
MGTRSSLITRITWGALKSRLPEARHCLIIPHRFLAVPKLNHLSFRHVVKLGRIFHHPTTSLLKLKFILRHIPNFRSQNSLHHPNANQAKLTVRIQQPSENDHAYVISSWSCWLTLSSTQALSSGWIRRMEFLSFLTRPRWPRNGEGYETSPIWSMRTSLAHYGLISPRGSWRSHEADWCIGLIM